MNPTETTAATPWVVLDTNATLDWLVFRDRGMDAISAAIETGALRWIATPRMREELLRTLGYTSLSRWNPNCERTLTVFDGLSQLKEEPTPTRHGPLVCSDPDDQVFIDLALAHRAPWLISHDRALHKLARAAAKHGTTVLRPRDWRPAQVA